MMNVARCFFKFRVKKVKLELTGKFDDKPRDQLSSLGSIAGKLKEHDEKYVEERKKAVSEISGICRGQQSDMAALTALVQEMKQEIAALKTAMVSGMGSVCPLVTAHMKPRDCKDQQMMGKNTSGEQHIYLPDSTGGERITVYCDMETDGGGWTVIQKRTDGKQDFYTSWQNYEVGFGNTTGEHWLGNKNIHAITSNGEYELLVVLTDFQRNTKKAKYSSFSVGDAKSNYKLDVSGYSGDAGDSLGFDHNGHAFSTADHDQDGSQNVNCAQKHHGGYWYSSCFKSNINGKWGTPGEQGIIWGSFKNWEMYVLKETAMMIRPAVK